MKDRNGRSLIVEAEYSMMISRDSKNREGIRDEGKIHFFKQYLRETFVETKWDMT